MKLGTKSVLFGAHCFLLHPWFVAAAWTRLYGFPRDIRLWVAFFVHDLGYIGKSAMDDEEGERHPELGARIMASLFDRRHSPAVPLIVLPDRRDHWHYIGPWGQFCLFHSRFLAKRLQMPYSRLCVADKLAIVLTPAWLYLPLASLTGEIEEYMAGFESRTFPPPKRQPPTNKRQWYSAVQLYMSYWVREYRDLKPDTWTNREPVDASGVWQ